MYPEQIQRVPKSTGSLQIAETSTNFNWDYVKASWHEGTPEDITHESAVIDSSSKVSLGLDYNRIEGWDNPNFLKRKQAGELIPYTPWLKEEEELTMTGGFDIEFDNFTINPPPLGTRMYHMRVMSDGWFIPDDLTISHGNLFTDSFSDQREELLSISSDAVVQEAAARIYTKGFDALTSGAEFHKTVRLFIGLKKRILKELRRGTLYNLWLEGRYGWRILMYELIELHEVLTKFSKKRSRYTEIAFSRLNERFSEEEPLVNFLLADPIQDWLPVQLYYILKVQYSKVISIKGSVAADFEPTQFRANPFDTAWELIPYSFVIDWFLDIGTWIQAMSLDSLATEYVAAGGFSMSVDKEFTVAESGLYNAGYATYFAGRRGLWLQGKRSLLLKKRTPTSISNVPQTELNLNAFKVLDLVALMESAIGNKGRTNKRLRI